MAIRSDSERWRRRIAGSLSAVGGLALLVLIGSCGSQEADDRGYLAKLEQARAEKDRFFREDSSSPVPADRRTGFPALAYFPPDPEYRVLASLEPVTSGEPIEMPTSTGQRRLMRRIGTLTFVLKAQPLRLTAFTEENDPRPARLFVPFADLTNGPETYPGGRYLDLDRTATGLYDLDFNRAYHPYCFYNASYDCPLPPPENRLKLPVRAGERLPPSGHKPPNPESRIPSPESR